MYTDLKEAVKSLQKDLSHGNVGYLNSMILGYQNYYCVATHVSIDMYKLEYLFNRTLYNRLKKHLKVKPKGKNKMLNTRYKDYNGKIYWLSDMPIYPISECNNIFPYAFNQLICNYTEEGRKKIHNNLSPYISSCINYLVRYPLRNESIELNDNRISKFSAQKGRCAISGEILEMNGFDVHHIKMKSDGGTDQYNNLICVTKTVHKLIHATNKDTIEAYMKSLNLGAKELVKLNEYRLKVGNLAI